MATGKQSSGPSNLSIWFVFILPDGRALQPESCIHIFFDPSTPIVTDELFPVEGLAYTVQNPMPSDGEALPAIDLVVVSQQEDPARALVDLQRQYNGLTRRVRAYEQAGWLQVIYWDEALGA